ncbi:MAG: hypothetical protein FGM53_04945 [Rhodocyclaceae bacterium]|nr:hypothetical protein [Rhodocyclaceae bacterium]
MTHRPLWQRWIGQLVTWARWSFAAFTLCYVVCAFAEESRSAAPKILRISGPISTQALSKLNADLMGFRNSDPVPAGLIVLLNSPGGDGDVAMQMGRLLRKHQAHIFVTHQCDSACALLFMGGVVRAALAETIGVHAGRLTVMNQDGKIVQEVDADRNLGNAFQLAAYNRDIRLYIEEMGIHHGILDVMLAHPISDVYKLNGAEMRRYQIEGISNDYLARRLRELKVNPSTHTITAVTLFNRSMSIPSNCSTSEFSNNQFIACYRRTLIKD